MSTVALKSLQKSKEDHRSRPKGLTSGILLYNVRWFIKVRWMVAVIFVCASFLGKLLYQPLQQVGIEVPFFSFFIISGILAFANIIYSIIVKKFDNEVHDLSVKIDLWVQIVFDLLIVSALVQIIGSTNTFIVFIYLFHIVLACIFLPKVKSLIITLIASSFYLIIILLELATLLPQSAVITSSSAIIHGRTFLDLIHVASAIFIWIVVWYLVSTIAETLRKRDHQFQEANEQLKEVNKENIRKLLIATHDLKAPFTGIESNIQVLKVVHWDILSQPLKDIINRIEIRAQTLRERINQILALENLKSKNLQTEELAVLDLQVVLNAVLKELEEKINDKHILLNAQIPSTSIHGDMKQLTMLFSNLVSNAVTYSHDGGTIDIGIEKRAREITVTIADSGIGIKEEALPHIFEEYYRTNEAQNFNKSSTGLGMAIVKEAALKMDANIKVSSEQNKGTTIEVAFPQKDATDSLMKNHKLIRSPDMHLIRS